jgi:hypothetical protein
MREMHSGTAYAGPRRTIFLSFAATERAMPQVKNLPEEENFFL